MLPWAQCHPSWAAWIFNYLILKFQAFLAGIHSHQGFRVTVRQCIIQSIPIRGTELWWGSASSPLETKCVRNFRPCSISILGILFPFGKESDRLQLDIQAEKSLKWFRRALHDAPLGSDFTHEHGFNYVEIVSSMAKWFCVKPRYRCNSYNDDGCNSYNDDLH